MSADISPEMLQLGRVTKFKMLFLVLVFVFNFDLFKFSAAILEKGLLLSQNLPKMLLVCAPDMLFSCGDWATS